MKALFKSTLHLAVTFVFVLCFAATASALVARPDWVEVDVSLRPDGKADVLYRINYDVKSGQMYAFYFQGTAGRPVFDRKNCFAESDSGKRYPLDITNLGSGKYDIVLSGGAGYGPGNLIFTLRYGTDLSASGQVALTESPELGGLVVFNLAHVKWDVHLSHQTIMVHYPI